MTSQISRPESTYSEEALPFKEIVELDRRFRALETLYADGYAQLLEIEKKVRFLKNLTTNSG